MVSHVAEFMLQKASAAAIRRIREHRASGHRTILITAAAEAFVRPLSPLFDVVIGAELEERDGRYTRLHVGPAARGEARAAWLRRYALLERVDLRHSYAYADSYSTFPCFVRWATRSRSHPTRRSTATRGVAVGRSRNGA